MSEEDWAAVSLFSMQPSTHAVDDKHTNEQRETTPLHTLPPDQVVKRRRSSPLRVPFLPQSSQTGQKSALETNYCGKGSSNPTCPWKLDLWVYHDASPPYKTPRGAHGDRPSRGA